MRALSQRGNRPRMETSQFKRHELFFSRIAKLSYPAFARLNHGTPGKKRVRGVLSAISPFVGGLESLQPVPEKMRLEIVIGTQNRIMNGQCSRFFCMGRIKRDLS